MDPRELSAVIVHYRTPAETVRAAQAVAATVAGAELIVVDNGSRDDVQSLLARQVPSARVIVEPENRGYGAACNRGAGVAAGRFLLFLNSDAFLQEGCAGELVRALEEDPVAALAGPRLLHEDGSLQPSIQRLPTPWRIFCESSGLAAASAGRGVFSGHTRTRQDHSRRRRVEALMGAVLLARRSAFEEVGGFDEIFFLYAEESDLIARLEARGRSVLFVPDAVAIHTGGASGGDVLFGRLHESLTLYVRKHHGRAAALLTSIVLRLGAAVRYAAALVTPGERGQRRRIRYRAALRRGAGNRESVTGNRANM